MHEKYIVNKDRLIFAMDVADCDQAKELTETLGDAVTFYKLGLELMMTNGYFDLMDWMLERDKKIFADLKFFDIPATVGSAVRQLKDRGASFVTIHGNQAIMEAAAENKGDKLKVLAVTALTSLDRGDLDDLGFDCNIEELVLSRAKRALQAGCDGVVASGIEVPQLRNNIDSKLLVITPGIRPVDNKPSQDQKRVVTVTKAFENGADYIVVGRLIRDADNPRNAAEEIQASISDCFE
ncbi:MAG: orotidine-5'-phosphate decarboxylase [Pseudomonadota bacterium]|nr:orotidine-5'-phosphate decarboxylase [Pseudomonadota bacterium]